MERDDAEPAAGLPLWQAALWVLFGGASAQVASGFVALKMQAWLTARGAEPATLGTSAAVIVPSVLASHLSLLALALLVPVLGGAPLRRALGLRPAPLACYAAAAFGTVMLSPLGDLLMQLMEELLPNASLGVVPMLHGVVRSMPVALALPVFALLPGVAEELVFRGLLQQAAGRGALAIAVSGVGFALFHIDPHHIAGVLPLGLFLAWVGARCGTYVTIFAHSVNNAVAVAAVHSTALDVGYGTEKAMPWPWVPISLGLVALSAVVVARTASGTPGHGTDAHA